MLDRVALEAFSPVGDQPVVVLDLAAAETASMAGALRAAQALVVGSDRAGVTPGLDPADFDVLLTIRPHAPAPWVSVTPGEMAEAEAAMVSAVRGQPVAAATLRHVLRLGERLSFEQALVVESLAYSALLGGEGFGAWRAARPARARSLGPGPFVLVERRADAVILTLNRPQARNAVCAEVRDDLFEALTTALEDPTAPMVTLTGAGPSFCAGGDLDEFGQATDLGLAHIVRVMRSPAALVHALGSRARVVLHGACIGAGIEFGAAAAKRIARPGAFFQLPEVGMGLIPGAGGTVTVPRAVGRHRAAWMAITGVRLDTDRALRWGLIHAVEPG